MSFTSRNSRSRAAAEQEGLIDAPSGRRFRARLRALVLLGATALVIAGLAMTVPAGSKAAASPVNPVKHVVVLYLENVSFH